MVVPYHTWGSPFSATEAETEMATDSPMDTTQAPEADSEVRTADLQSQYGALQVPRPSVLAYAGGVAGGLN